MQKTIEQRAKETVQRRVLGSFGYRAADSVLSGFDATENVNIYKSHGGTIEGLEESLNLAIERAEPEVSAAEIASSLDVDAGEAKQILEEQQLEYKDMQENRDQYLKQLQNLYKKADGKYDHLSSFSVDNFQRIADNLVRAARKQFVRTKNPEWAKAVQDAVTPMLSDVMAKAQSTEK